MAGFGYDQTEADVDDLESKLAGIEPDTRVRLTWRSRRAGGDVTHDGITVDPDRDGILLRATISDMKGDVYCRRNGDFEITVTSTGSSHTSRQPTVGWLVDVDVLEAAPFLDRIRGTWDDDDPSILRWHDGRGHVVADVDGELRAFHSRLLDPRTVDESVVDDLIVELGVPTVAPLSSVDTRFTREQFEWDAVDAREGSDGD